MHPANINNRLIVLPEIPSAAPQAQQETQICKVAKKALTLLNGHNVSEARELLIREGGQGDAIRRTIRALEDRDIPRARSLLSSILPLNDGQGAPARTPAERPSPAAPLPAPQTAGVPRLLNFPDLLDVKNKESISRAHEFVLRGVCDFIYYPTIEQLRRYTEIATCMNRAPDAPAQPVLVRHVLNHMPTEIVGWIIDTLLKKYSCQWMRRERTEGCATARVANRDELERLLEFSNGVMFDLNGIWYVSQIDSDLRAVQAQELSVYCVYIKGGIAPIIDPRLPKSPMGLELCETSNIFE